MVKDNDQSFISLCILSIFFRETPIPDPRAVQVSGGFSNVCTLHFVQTPYMRPWASKLRVEWVTHSSSVSGTARFSWGLRGGTAVQQLENCADQSCPEHPAIMWELCKLVIKGKMRVITGEDTGRRREVVGKGRKRLEVPYLQSVDQDFGSLN